VTVRNDTGVYEGGEISLYYDPMIAKLVTHAPTRDAAIAAQSRALDAFAISGIRHNIPFLAALMAHPRWQAAKLSTGFIAEEFPRGFHPVAADGEHAQVLAAVAAAIDHRLGARKRKISGQLTGRCVTRATVRSVWLDGRAFILEVTGDDTVVEFGNGVAGAAPPAGNDNVAITYRDGTGDRSRILVRSPWVPGEPVWRGSVGEREVAVQVRPVPNGFDLAWHGSQARAYVYTETEAAAARLMPVKSAADTGKKLLCPMPGLVVAVTVAVGQEVKAGETLAVVEAMKMENVLRAERDGVVKAIHAKKGDSLAVDAVILEFE
jgi:propionyl-CoA carboxylase alpha chain